MKYSVDKQEKYTVLTLEETNFNSEIAPKFKTDIIFMAQEGIPNLILDLSHVKYADSSGLSAILMGHRLWKDIGNFIIAGELQSAVKTLFEISRTNTILTFIPTVSESIDYVMMDEIERELTAE